TTWRAGPWPGTRARWRACAAPRPLFATPASGRHRAALRLVQLHPVPVRILERRDQGRAHVEDGLLRRWMKAHALRRELRHHGPEVVHLEAQHDGLLLNDGARKRRVAHGEAGPGPHQEFRPTGEGRLHGKAQSLDVPVGELVAVRAVEVGDAEAL